MKAGTLLGFDFGERRIGVAVGDAHTRIAHPLGMIDARAKTDSRTSLIAKTWRERATAETPAKAREALSRAAALASTWKSPETDAVAGAETALAAGLVDEVRALRARGDLHAALPSMRSVGYRQAWEALDAGLQGPALRQDVATRGAAATRQLAKRQLTWLRSMDRTPLAVDAHDEAELVRQCAARWPALARS